MPNHKLGERITSHMRSVASQLFQRRLGHLQCGFPLTREQLQAGIIPAGWRKVVLEIIRQQPNVAYIDAITSPRVWFGEAASDPDLAIPRPVKLELDLDRYRVAYCTNPIKFDMHVIDREPELQARLVAYCNKIVLEERMTRLANKTIGVFLGGISQGVALAPTVSHVLARWPALAILTDPDMTTEYSSHHNSEQIRQWHQRFRDPSERLGRYLWYRGEPEAVEWYQKHKQIMHLVDGMIAAAKILPQEITDKAECKASIKTWRPLPEDRDKP